MLKRLAFLTLFLTGLAFGQSQDDFGGTGVINNDRYLWKTPTGTAASANGSMEMAGDGTAQPYHVSGPTNYGYIYYDSALTGNWEAYIVFSQKGGTDNTRYFAIGAATSSNWTAAVGYFGALQEMTTSGGVDRYVLKRMTGTMSTLGGTNPSDFTETRQVSSEFAVGDTFGITVWASDDRFTIWKRANGGPSRDTLSSLSGQHDLSTGAYVWIGGAELATPFKITHFGVRAAGTAAPPPSSTDDTPPVTTLTVQQTATLGQLLTASGSVTDDSAANQTIVAVDTGTGYNTILTQTYVGTVTSGTFSAPTFTRYTAGTATVRAISSDHNKNDAAIRRDTVTKVVTFSAAPVVTASKFKVFAWVTFQDTRWPAPYSGGTVPVDSIPWDILTHVSLFAANGQNPLTQTGYINQYGPMTQYAHSKNVAAGLCVGGSGDAALVTMIGGGQASWLSWINHYLTYVDAHRMDFIDFDLEGTYTTANIEGFFSLLYDSLNVAHRYQGIDPSKKPYIVFTAGVSRAISSASSAVLMSKVEFVNLMTYDYNNNAWNRVTFDNSPKSYLYYNGTGGATDSVGTGVNAIAPSMQRMAIRVNQAGWPMNKLNVGMDFNGGGWNNASQIRQSTAGTSSGGSNATFANQWASWSTLHPDSIFFDQIAQAYWARIGTNLYTWLALPGRDSGVIATRKVVDSMGLGGVDIWNFGNEVWNTPSANIPSGGRGWFFSQLRQHFGTRDTITGTLAPPTTFNPANGATGVSTAPTLDWNEVANAFRYHVRVTNSSGAIVLDDTTLAVSQKAASGLTNGATYTYQVRVKNNALVWGQFSTPIIFTVVSLTPGAPTIIFPVTGTTLSGTQTPVTWNASTDGPTTFVAGTSFYEVHVSVSAAFASTFKRDSTTNNGNLTRTYSLFGMANSTVYYIRVRGKTSAGYGPWSSTVQITTGAAPPVAPILSSPGNNVGNRDTVNLTLSWAHATNYVYYRAQVDDDPLFGSMLVNTTTSSNSIVIADLDGNKTYYWRVRTIGATDSSAFSDAFTFTTSQAAPPPPPRSTVQMGYWYSLDEGRWVWNRPAPWVIYGYSRSDMADVTPPEAGVIAWSPYGIKLKTDWGTDTTLLYSFGGVSGGTTTAATIRDSLEYASGLATATLQNTIVEGDLTISAQDDDVEKGFFKISRPSSIAYITVTPPARSGRLAVADGEDLSPNSLVLPTSRLGQPSGGFGMNPQDARDAGLGYGLWGYDPTIATPEWSLIPITGLAPYKIVNHSNITGPKYPWLDANGVMQWSDTTGLMSGGSGTLLSDVTDDTAKAWIHFRNSTTPDTAGLRFYGHDAAGAFRGQIYADDTYFGLFASASNFPSVVMGTDAGVRAYGNSGTEITQGTATERIVRIRSVQTNSDVEEHYWAARVTTADAVLTTLTTINLDATHQNVDYSADNTTFLIEVDVYASRTDGTDGYAAYTRRIVIRNAVGTVTEIAEQTIGTDVESNAAYDCVFDVTGDTFRIQVQGAGTDPLTWHTSIRIKPLTN